MQVVRDSVPDLDRQRLLIRALWITILGNLGLVIGKGIVATITDSVALYADAANSASDLFYSLLMSLGLWISQRPPDLSHPQGHSRFEPLAGLIIAAAMTFAAYEAGRVAVQRFIAGGTSVPLEWPVIALLISAAVKGVMYAVIHNIAGKANSSTLDAAAKDNLADVLTSIAAFGGILASQFIHPLADPIAGAAVALWIARAAIDVWGENLNYLTGGGASEALRQEILTASEAIEGVERVHQVITEYVGPELIADLHINVDGNLSLFDVHTISDRVRESVEALDGIDRAYVHVEPCEIIQRSAPLQPRGPAPDSET